MPGFYTYDQRSEIAGVASVLLAVVEDYKEKKDFFNNLMATYNSVLKQANDECTKKGKPAIKRVQLNVPAHHGDMVTLLIIKYQALNENIAIVSEAIKGLYAQLNICKSVPSTSGQINLGNLGNQGTGVPSQVEIDALAAAKKAFQDLKTKLNTADGDINSAISAASLNNVWTAISGELQTAENTIRNELGKLTDVGLIAQGTQLLQDLQVYTNDLTNKKNQKALNFNLPQPPTAAEKTAFKAAEDALKQVKQDLSNAGVAINTAADIAGLDTVWNNISAKLTTAEGVIKSEFGKITHTSFNKNALIKELQDYTNQLTNAKNTKAATLNAGAAPTPAETKALADAIAEFQKLEADLSTDVAAINAADATNLPVVWAAINKKLQDGETKIDTELKKITHSTLIAQRDGLRTALQAHTKALTDANTAKAASFGGMGGKELWKVTGLQDLATYKGKGRDPKEITPANSAIKGMKLKQPALFTQFKNIIDSKNDEKLAGLYFAWLDYVKANETFAKTVYEYIEANGYRTQFDAFLTGVMAGGFNKQFGGQYNSRYYKKYIKYKSKYMNLRKY